MGEVAETLTGVAPSASAVSRLNQTLTQQFESWRERRLQEHWRIVYLDGVYFPARHGDQTDSTVLLTALGVDLEGNKEVVALRACAEESKDGWSCLLQDMRQRGATQIDLIVTDGHEGILSAVAALFPLGNAVSSINSVMCMGYSHRQSAEVATSWTQMS